jgi:hypothetical protein
MQKARGREMQPFARVQVKDGTRGGLGLAKGDREGGRRARGVQGCSADVGLARRERGGQIELARSRIRKGLGLQKFNEPHFPPSCSSMRKHSRKKVNIKYVEGYASFTGKFSESQKIAKRWRKIVPKSRKNTAAKT